MIDKAIAGGPTWLRGLLRLMSEAMVVEGRVDPARAPWRPFLAAVSVLAVIGLLGLAATSYVALRTSSGVGLDARLLDAVSSTTPAHYQLHSDLRGSARWSILLLALAGALPALVRPRLGLWLGAGIVITGANVAAQVLQHDVFTRPGVSPGTNGLPSQHMTVAFSLALAAVVVAPSAWRSMMSIGVSAAATLVGLALVLGRWHRPSDVVAAIFLCMAWAGPGLLVAGLVRRRPLTPASSTLTLVGGLIGAWTVSLVLVWRGARPPPGLPDLWLAIISLGSIGLACAIGVAAVARVADRHLG